MAEKRYRVTVEFAHGVRHIFDGLTTAKTVKLEQWADGLREDIMKFDVDGKTYYLNRDYLCSMVVEKLEETER